MSLSTRARQKGTVRATALLPPGTRVRAYAVGRAHARMTTRAVVVGGLFVLAFLVALALGYLIIPGVLLVLVLVHEIRPPRAVVVTDQGIGIVARSLWNGGASKVLALLPLAPLRTPAPSGSVTIDFGAERITLSRREFEMASTAADAAGALSAPPPQMAPPGSGGAMTPPPPPPPFAG